MLKLAIGIGLGLLFQALAAGQNGIAPLSFDSAARAVGEAARALGGAGRGILDPYPGLAQPLMFALRFAPEWLRRSVLNFGMSFSLGVAPSELARLDPDAFFRYYTSRYPERKYPAIILGSPDGALAYLAALLNAPLLPVSGLVGVRHRIDPDDLQAYLATGLSAARVLTPSDVFDLVIHYDPIHDRGLVKYAALIRVKLRRIPAVYREFISEHLTPGGTLILAEDRYPWPQFELEPGIWLQIGGLGGIPPQEYLERYRPEGADQPQPRPESEWGCPEEFSRAARDLVSGAGYRLLEIPADHPSSYSLLSLNAYLASGARKDLVFLSCFTTMDARLPRLTGIPPLHLPFNTRDNLGFAVRALAGSGFKKAFLALHPSYDPPPDIVPLKSWQAELGKLGIATVPLLGKRFWPLDPYAPFEAARWFAWLIKSYRLPRPLSLSPEELAGLVSKRGTSARSPRGPERSANSTP